MVPSTPGGGFLYFHLKLEGAGGKTSLFLTFLDPITSVHVEIFVKGSMSMVPCPFDSYGFNEHGALPLCRVL